MFGRFQTCLDLTENMNRLFHLAGLKGSVKETVTMVADFFVPSTLTRTKILG
jgi:hypothetical protein